MVAQSAESNNHMSEPTLNRRDLFAGIAALGMAGVTSAAETGVPQRPLGRTGEKVSMIGLGGSHIGESNLTDDQAIKLMRTAIDNGVTFMDNCWDYHGGRSEERMGKALQDGYRQKVFLMTKLDGRTKQSASKQLDDSLRRLQTDHIDLLQFHEVIRYEDPDRIFADDGVVVAFQDAKKAGKIRHWIHRPQGSTCAPIHAAGSADNGFQFDTVQMPLNPMDAHYRSFQHLVLPELVKQNIGVLGMKSMGSGVILKSNTVSPVECLHYAMNLPTSVVITGIDSQQVLDQDLKAARDFKPLDKQEVSAILKKTTQAAKHGKFELFKTTAHFDGTAHNPQWLGGESNRTEKLDWLGAVVRMGRGHVALDRILHESGDIMDVELAHQTGAIRIHRFRTQFKACGDLFCANALDQQREYLILRALSASIGSPPVSFGDRPKTVLISTEGVT